MALVQPYSKFKTFLGHGQTVSAWILSVRGTHSLPGVPFHLCLIVSPWIEQKSASVTF